MVKTLASLVHELDRAAILVTHDLRLVQYVDRVIEMEDGRIAHMRTSDEIAPVFPMRAAPGEALTDGLAAAG
ncbi:MAG: hypothetical protein V1772_03320 [Chloroflexota bacterium]